MIVIESKRKKPATILKKYPDAILADVTSGAKGGGYWDEAIRLTSPGFFLQQNVITSSGPLTFL